MSLERERRHHLLSLPKRSFPDSFLRSLKSLHQEKSLPPHAASIPRIPHPASLFLRFTAPFHRAALRRGEPTRLVAPRTDRPSPARPQAERGHRAKSEGDLVPKKDVFSLVPPKKHTCMVHMRVSKGYIYIYIYNIYSFFFSDLF